MAGDKKIVDVKFWEDDLVMDKMTNEERYFFFYLMTNPKHRLCGIYRLPLREIKFVANIDNAEELLKKFEEEFKIIAYSYDTQEIAVFNALKYSIVSGGNPLTKQLIKELERVEDGELILTVYNQMFNFWEESTRQTDKIARQLFKEALEKRHLISKDVYENKDAYVYDNYAYENEEVNANVNVGNYAYGESGPESKKHEDLSSSNEQENDTPQTVDDFLSQPEFNPEQ